MNKNIHISNQIPNKAELKAFIQNLDFDALDKNSLEYRNTRNAVYFLKLPFMPKELVLKRSRPSPTYKPHRKLSFYLRNLFKHYGKRGFYGALLLSQNGIKTIKPIAYWKYKVAAFKYEACFIYEKLDCDCSVLEYINENAESDSVKKREMCHKLIEGAAELGRKIHSSNLRHGDFILNNVLVRFKDKPQDVELMVIDTDHVSVNYWPTKFLKTFFALKCFRRFKSDCISNREFLKLYFQEQYKEFWHQVLEFWRHWDHRPISRLRKQLIAKISGIKQKDNHCENQGCS